MILPDQWPCDDFAASSKNSKKIFEIAKIDVVCLRLFCELAKVTESLLFNGDKNENNAL